MTTDTNIALFKGAGLPAADLARFKQALVTTQQAAAVAGNTPFLRMLKQDGAWVYGANETEVQEGSHWAINPLSLKIGFVAWNPAGGKPLGKHMRSIFQQPLVKTELPDMGAPWDENVSFELQCTNGEDKGITIEYTANSYGGRKAFSDLVGALQAQLDSDPANIVPVVELTNTSYAHSNKSYGTIYNPVFEIVSWISMQGAPAVAGANGTEPERGPPEKPRDPVQPEPPPATTVPPRRPRRGPMTDAGTNSGATADRAAMGDQVQGATAAAASTAANPVQRERRRRTPAA